MLWSTRSRMCGSPRSLLQHAVLFCWLVLWFSDTGEVLECLSLGWSQLSANCPLNFGCSLTLQRFWLMRGLDAHSFLFVCGHFLSWTWGDAWCLFLLNLLSLGFSKDVCVLCPKCCPVRRKRGTVPALRAPSWGRLLVTAGRRGGQGGGVQGRQRLRASGEEQGADVVGPWWSGKGDFCRIWQKCMGLVITQEITEKLLAWRARSEGKQDTVFSFQNIMLWLPGGRSHSVKRPCYCLFFC